MLMWLWMLKMELSTTYVFCENEEAQHSYFSLNKSEAMRWAEPIAHDGDVKTWWIWVAKPEGMRPSGRHGRWDNIFKIDIHMVVWYGLDLFCAEHRPIAGCREHHNKTSVSVKGNKLHGWVIIDFKDGVYRPTHAAYRVQLEQDASNSSVSYCLYKLYEVEILFSEEEIKSRLNLENAC